MEQNVNPNPVVIMVNEQGANLIKAVCDATLKQAGTGGLNAVNLILSNIKILAPPQAQVPIAKKEEKPEEPKKKGK